MKSFLPDKVYLVLKWLCILVLPAVAVFIKTVFPIWGWPFADEISTTIIAADTLIGAIIGLSTAQYNSNKE